MRSWFIDQDGGLRPLHAELGTWDAPVATAVCDSSPATGHVAPASDCSCGLYGSYELPARTRPGCVTGAIQAWGKVELHFSGFRAQHARPVALVLPPRASTNLRPRLERAAQRYGAQLVPSQDELLSVAAEWGSPVALQDRPFSLLSRVVAADDSPDPAMLESPAGALQWLYQRTLEQAGGQMPGLDLERMSDADVADELLAVRTLCERGIEATSVTDVQLGAADRGAVLRHVGTLDAARFRGFWVALAQRSDGPVAREFMDAGCRETPVVALALGLPLSPPNPDSWTARTAQQRLLTELQDPEALRRCCGASAAQSTRRSWNARSEEAPRSGASSRCSGPARQPWHSRSVSLMTRH
ncbi:hypothetical protein C7Y72_04105 [Paraconexibacter algicola]|uniref:Uncharacterized protein n=1 Tax=Paraconexibacter algicola TaxID=2133960 RepID=A0A2T4UI22_9ACTN|nr:hypothetical protein C7Y72_04105 [Paraconexibacter algicola]